MRSGVKWGLIGGFITGVLLWGRYGEVFPLMYLLCLVFGALAGREAKRTPVLAVGVISGVLTAFIYHVAYYIHGAMEGMAMIARIGGLAIQPLGLLRDAIELLPASMIDPYTLGRIAIGIVFGAIGAVIGRALTQASQRVKTPVDPASPSEPSDPT